VGQFCTNPGLVVGLAGDAFDEVALETGREISGVDAGVMLNRRIRDAYGAGVESLGTRIDVEQLAAGRAATGEAVAGQARLFRTRASALLGDRSLSEEVFGPSTLFVAAENRDELMRVADELVGHLTCTLHGTADDLADFADLVQLLQEKAGRLIFNGYPTGVEVCDAMTHGGPFPATTDPHFTSVGTAAIYRFARPVSWQDFPDEALPAELQDANPRGIMRRVDGTFTRDPLGG